MISCMSFVNISWGAWESPTGAEVFSIISIVIDAPQDATSSLSGKLGMIRGVTAKTLTAKI